MSLVLTSQVRQTNTKVARYHRTTVSLQRKGSLQVESHLSALPKGRAWLKMLMRLSLVEISCIIEKIFAFSESGHPYSSYMHSVFICLPDLLKSISKTFKIIAQNYRQMTSQYRETGYSKVTKFVSLKTPTKQTPRCFHTFAAQHSVKNLA